METLEVRFKKAWPYQNDALNLPVQDVEAALPFYETIMGFRLLSKSDAPHRSVLLARDEVKIGLAENGGDPTQDGCFFEVDNAENAFQQLKMNGLDREAAVYETQQHGNTKWKVFFVVAPDGLCYCLGERLP